ncbi:IgA peptidase M64-domain-containing protein [Schizophyllum amplum]|uniref:IgA peptidase M64-domain-containing protein n=1 Tax=Schizophyllum amplum TaxID=97359 RepID=A0A550CBH6_9AGAR|nr:IgA peptidase M64-domain-containing protein [Auriculariopsis ampla]
MMSYMAPILTLALFGEVLGHAGHGHSPIVLAESGQQPLRALPPPPPMELRSLMAHGPSENRIDLVFFADGYLASEKAAFFGDAMMLAEGLVAGNKTYGSVEPLLNMWAAFTASAESGIGWGGVPKNTTYGLYRDGTELRAVYVGKPDVNVAACKALGTQCDFPIILGNSPLYGGLESRHNEGATTITNSPANGVLVLRHELGHSIPWVGEEYDGGDGYYGANTASSTREVPWAHWLVNEVGGGEVGGATDVDGAALSPDDDALSSEGERSATPRVERSVMPFQAYPWTLLNTSAPWSATFPSSGAYARALVRFSLSGLPLASDARVLLDGRDLGWVPRAGIGMDRWHYDIYVPGRLGEGEHELVFELLEEEREGEAQLCNMEVLEFGEEDEFDARPGVYGLFPTFDDQNATRFRPTNEDCLMRLVTAPGFCNVCLESLWLTLLAQVDLIDGVDETCGPEGVHAIDLRLVALGQLREKDIGVKERYTVTWSKDDAVMESLTDAMAIAVRNGETWTVDVAFSTEEVRKDEEGRLLSTRTVTTSHCA